jgi:virginiamycin A acetyltransferase
MTCPRGLFDAKRAIRRIFKNIPESTMISSSEVTPEHHSGSLAGMPSVSVRLLDLARSILKALLIASAMIIVALPAFTCWLERLLANRDIAFLIWGQAFALLPGLPGSYVRKCFYFLTLRRCPLDCDIGFLTFIHDRRAQIGTQVYIGTGVGIGWVNVGDGCLLASRVSILSGRAQHQSGPDGRLTPFDRSAAEQIHIGHDTWIGEGSIIMADVESHCIVGAGSIVTKPVTSGSIVAGNPARVIRRLINGNVSVSITEDNRPTS